MAPKDTEFPTTHISGPSCKVCNSGWDGRDCKCVVSAKILKYIEEKWYIDGDRSRPAPRDNFWEERWGAGVKREEVGEKKDGKAKVIKKG